VLGVDKHTVARDYGANAPPDDGMPSGLAAPAGANAPPPANIEALMKTTVMRDIEPNGSDGDRDAIPQAVSGEPNGSPTTNGLGQVTSSQESGTLSYPGHGNRS
jgi:hypothetical protein